MLAARASRIPFLVVCTVMLVAGVADKTPPPPPAGRPPAAELADKACTPGACSRLWLYMESLSLLLLWL